MSDPFEFLKSQAQTDQLTEAAKGMAKSAAAMYRAYLEAGLPEDLAADLITDWHMLMWTQTALQRKPE